MQVFANKEKIGILSKTGNTTVQLSSSVITLGARQYTTGNLVCDTSISGVGGLDIGIIAPSETYNIYAVIQSGSVALVFSLANSPVGFSKYKKLGEMRTNGSSQIYEVINLGEVFSDRFETKILQTNQEVDGIITDLNLDNLVIGKVYRVEIQAHMSNITQSSARAYITFANGATPIGEVQSSIDFPGAGLGNHWSTGSTVATFTATDTTVRFTGVSLSATPAPHRIIAGDGTKSLTYVTLTELNSTIEVV